MTRRGMALTESFVGSDLPKAVIVLEVVVVFVLTAIALPLGLGKVGIGPPLGIAVPLLLMVFWIRFYSNVYRKH